MKFAGIRRPPLVGEVSVGRLVGVSIAAEFGGPMDLS